MHPHQVNKINANGGVQDPSRAKLMYGIMPRRPRKDLVYFDSASYAQGLPTGDEHPQPGLIPHKSEETPRAPVLPTHAKSRLREQVVPDTSGTNDTANKGTASDDNSGNPTSPAQPTYMLSRNPDSPGLPHDQSGVPKSQTGVPNSDARLPSSQSESLVQPNDRPELTNGQSGLPIRQ